MPKKTAKTTKAAPRKAAPKRKPRRRIVATYRGEDVADMAAQPDTGLKITSPVDRMLLALEASQLRTKNEAKELYGELDLILINEPEDESVPVDAEFVSQPSRLCRVLHDLLVRDGETRALIETMRRKLTI